MASEEDLKMVTSASFGSLGPIGVNVKIVIDNEVANMINFVCGANKDGYHYKNVNLSDFEVYMQGDIVNICEGDVCPCCDGHIYFKKGIEIGNTFKLGTKYSLALGLNYLDKENKLKPVYMGCYGIGVARCMAAIAEQKADEKGLVWPVSVAPFTVCITVINAKDEKQMCVANDLYDEFNKEGIDVLFDDRDERAGVKFKDMELLGVPYRVTIGRKAIDGILELKSRDGKIDTEISKDDIIKEIKKYV